MRHIRPDCAEQSSTNFPLQRRHKPNSLAVRLTRDVLLLRSTGSSRRAIAAALNLSHRRVQTILNGAAPAVRGDPRPFVMRERDADYSSVEAALRAGSTMRAEHLAYATRCPAPYSYSYFWRRFEDWLEAQPDPSPRPSLETIDRGKQDRVSRRGSFGDSPKTDAGAEGASCGSSGLPGGGATSAAPSGLTGAIGGSLGFPGLPRGSDDGVGRRRAVGFHDEITAKLRLQSEIRFSPANAAPETEDSRDVLSGGAPLEGGLLFISEPDTALQIRKGALCVRYRDGVERTFPRTPIPHQRK